MSETRLQIHACQIPECSFQACARCYQCSKYICPDHTQDTRRACVGCNEPATAQMCPDCATNNRSRETMISCVAIVALIFIIAIVFFFSGV